MSAAVPVVLALSALVTLDAGLRRVDFYGWTASSWPAAWREVPPQPGRPSPYREGARGRWVLVVGAGVPRAISVFLAPLLGVTLLWTLATVLALGDLRDVARGTRALPFVLASLSLAVIRALAGGTALVAACEGWRRRFFVASAVGLGLDAALARFALPCSDLRTDDVRMALAGGAVQGAMVLGFAFSAWRRRGLVASPGRSDAL